MLARLTLLIFLCSKVSAAAKQPNIVFILADDLGFNDVGYHNPEIISPNLDKIAKEGVILENYYVQPICTPSRSQLLTGRYQIRYGLQHDVILAPQRSCLPLDEVTLPEKLKEVGYETHIVGKWHLGFYKNECLPTNRGFDSYYGMFLGKGDYYTHDNCGYFPDWEYSKQFCGYDFHDNLDVDWSANGTYSTYLFSARSRKIIKQHDQTKPLFLFLSLQSVHSPTDAPKKYVNMYRNITDKTRRVYSGMVTAMDDTIGVVVDALKETGMFKNTLIVFSTDNGGQPNFGGSNLPLRGQKNTLWEGGIRGIGFVGGVGIKKPGRISKELYHISDWFPTLLHLAGGDAKHSKPLDGVNIWDSLSLDNVTSPRFEILHSIEPLYPESGILSSPNKYGFNVSEGQAALRMGRWKLITGNPGYDWYGEETNLRLYDIDDDPSESLNLVKWFPEVVDAMLGRLAEYNATSVPVKWASADVRSNPALRGNAWGPWE